MGRAFEFRKARKMKRWSEMAKTFTRIGKDKLWANDKDLASHMKKQSLKEHLVPNDLIDSALFLASKASRMMTGQALVVDGGVVVTG